jgi:Protein of unknown function (DUF4239)
LSLVTVFYAVPAWFLLIAVIAVFAGVACAVLVLTRRALPRVDFRAHNDVVGVFTSIVGSLFTVMVAFIIAIVWQEFNVTQQRVATEVASAKDLWHIAAGFPPPLTHRLQTTMTTYARMMVDDEWPAMRHGGDSRAAEVMLSGAYEDVIRFQPSRPGEAVVQSAALQDFSALRDARQNRLDDNRRGIAPFEWGTLLLGSAAVIILCCLVGIANRRMHFVLVAAVAAMIAAAFVLIFELDYPFRGDVAVPVDLWRGFLLDHR